MFWHDIIIKACENLQIAKKEITVSEKKLLEEVSKIAREDKKIVVVNMQTKIDNVMRLRKDEFESLRKGVYRLKDETDEQIDKEWKKEKKQLVIFDEQLKEISLSEHERLVLIKQRIGQGAFRKKLQKKWQGCSVTGYNQKEILIASHIKPWSKAEDEEKLDGNNGLLLVANLDKAFDQGLITFEDDGNILISDNLENPEDIGITQNMKLSKIFEGNNKYLTHHREHVFNKE